MQHVIVIRYADDLPLIDDLSRRQTTTAAFLRTGKRLQSLGQQTVLFFAGSVSVRQACKTASYKQSPASLQRQSESSEAECV